MSIRKRILIPMIVLTVVCSTAVLISSILLFDQELHRAAHNRIEVASMTAEHEIEIFKSASRMAAVLIAENQHLKDAVKSRDRDRIMDSVEVLLNTANVEFCTILDSQGIVLVRTHEPDTYGDSLSWLQNVESALAGKTETTFEEGTVVRLAVRTGTPIYDEEGILIGVATMGYRFDTVEFVQMLKEVTGCEVTIFLGDERISSTITDENGKPIAGTKVSGEVGDIIRQILEGEPYIVGPVVFERSGVAKYMPLRNTDNEIVGVMCIGDYLDVTMQRIDAFIVNGVLITLVVLVAMILCAVYIAKGLEHRLEHMMNAIHEADERALILYNSMPVGGNLWNKDLKLIDCNQEMLNLFGIEDKEEYLKVFNNLTPEYQPNGRKSVEYGLELIQKTFDEGYQRVEWLHTRRDGEPLPVITTFVRVKYRKEDIVAAYIHDIRDIKTAIDEKQIAIEKARIEEERSIIMGEAYQQLKSVMDMVPVGVILINLEKLTLVYYNKAVSNIFDIEFSEDYEGCRILDFLPEMQSDGRKTIDTIQYNMQNSVLGAKVQCLKANGEPFTSRISTVTINYSGTKVALSAIEDITNEEKYRQSLKNAAFREQEANQLKSRFLANVSHEIRTPMNAIIGLTELALRDEEASVKNEHIQMVKQAGTNLLAIISDILDFSKIEAGKMDIISEEYSISSLINDVVNIIKIRLVDSQIYFAVKVDRNIPRTLYGDETRIRQAVLNLLNNATKYTERGYVCLGVYGEFKEDGTGTMIFEVKDTGIGIKKENIDKLFTDFTQFDIERHKGIEGVGLGLAISNRLVKAMNGTIDVTSEYGKGSTFTITLPQIAHSAKALAEVSRPEEKNVLIYDYCDIYTESLAYTMDNLGLNYTTVKCGAGLYKNMKNRTYDFLFISFKMYKENEDTIKEYGNHTKTIILAELDETITGLDMDVLAMPVTCTQIADVVNGKSNHSFHTENDGHQIVPFAPGTKVLVVDDIYTNLKVAEGLLTQYNIQVDLCNSGIAAIEAMQNLHVIPNLYDMQSLNEKRSLHEIKGERYNLVFMDHKMPGMDGVETTRRIREMGENDMYYKEVPIIALTANAISGTREMFLENGFNDFLPKPIDTAVLYAILEKWLPRNH